MDHGGIIRILHLIHLKRLRNVSMNVSSLTLTDLICVLNTKNRCGRDTVLAHSTSNVLSPQAAGSYGRKNKLSRINQELGNYDSRIENNLRPTDRCH